MLSDLSSGELSWLIAFIAIFLLMVVVLGWASIYSGGD
jgi:hypothetical protein